jgi:hypothetical protein
MKAEVREGVLQALVEQVEAFPVTPWSGLSARQIREYGFYLEPDLRLEEKDLLLGQLYAGLAVLARDMHDHLAKHPRDDAEMFRALVQMVNTEDRARYGSGAFPEYDGHPVSLLPKGLAAAADSGKPTVTPLADPRIVHEWTSKPGKKLFDRFLQKFGRKLKETICGKDGPYEQFNKGLLGQTALPTSIASTILTAGFSAATFWYPLAVYLSILLVKAGLKTYCET